MRIRTLGGLGIEGVPSLRTKPLLLCAYLAIEGPKPRRHLARLFWRDAKDPAGSLRVALSRTRSLGQNLVRSDGRRLSTGATVDVQELIADLERGTADRIDTYEGPFLQGIDGPAISGELEEWILDTRDWFASRIRHGLIALAERHADRLELDEARRLGERALTLSGLDAVDPDQVPRLHRVLDRCASGETARVEAVARSYGMNLAAPVDGVEREAARAPSHARPNPPNHLPEAAGTFVGRLAEIATASDLLDRGQRVLTFVGGAGVGKTRLAIEVARRRLDAGRCPDGAYFVDLAAVDRSGGVADRIARALGVVVQARGGEARQLATAVATRQLLVILDNVEHVLESVREIISAIGGCAGLELLITSRARLGTPDEWTLTIEGFDVPDESVDDAVALRSDAMRLFGLRAVRTRGRSVMDVANVGDVRRICRAVAGSPLGLELAAPWLRVLSVHDLADELDRGLALLEEGEPGWPDRQRGLRAAFEHSWSLLSERDRQALRRLSVFRGGFRREIATEVAGVTLPTLARLVDASLLTVSDSGRYERHPFLSTFTEEKLAEHPAERDEVRARHGRSTLRLLARLYPGTMGGSAAAAAMDRIEEEEANIVAAWEWALAEGAWDDLLAAHPCLAAYAEYRARYHYGHALSDRIVRGVRADGPRSTLLLALAYATRGFCVFRAGDPERVRADAEEALARLPDLDPHDPACVAATWWAWHALGIAAKVQGDGQESIRASERALHAAERALASSLEPAFLLPYSVQAGMNHHVVCLGLLQRGELDEAEEHDRASRAHFRRVGSHAESYGCQTSGLLRLLQGRWDAAVREIEHGLALSRMVGYVTATANLLEGLVRAELGRGDATAAERACDEALRLTDDVGDVWLGTSLRALKGSLLAGRGDAVEADAWFARAWDMADRYGLQGYGMEAVVGKARLDLEAGRHERAVPLLRFVRTYALSPGWIREAAEADLVQVGRDGSDPPAIDLDDVRALMASA
jgi:predicted ATPase